MRRIPFHLFLTLFLILPLAACDSDGDDNSNGNGNGGDVGEVDVTITGAIDGSFTGNAFFVDESDDDRDFAIGLFSGAIANPSAGEIVVLGRDGDRPGEGTYEIGADETETTFFGVYAENLGTTTSGVFVTATTGSLTITSSSSSRVAGTFTFTGQAFTSQGGQLGTATVQGSFSAEFVDDASVPTFP